MSAPLVKRFPVEIIITLPSGEVICRQTWHEVTVPPGHCPRLAVETARKQARAVVKAGVKVEVVL